MQTSVSVTCPHCQLKRPKQITVDGFSDEFKVGQAFTCAAINDEGCNKDFVIYSRASIEIKTKAVAE